jgi:thiol-disulfide isomerase/thioredoxin
LVAGGAESLDVELLDSGTRKKDPGNAGMTDETNTTLPKASPITRVGIPAMLAFAFVAILYVLFSAGSKPQDAPSSGLERLAVKSLSKLVVASGQRLSLPTQPVISPQNTQTTLEAYRGRIVLVNFWATWCSPCVKEMPTLAALQTSYSPSDVAVIPVSVDRAGDQAKAGEALKTLSNGALPHYGDPSMGTVFELKARGFPTTVIFGRDGREIARVEGDVDWNSVEAKALIDELLKPAAG